MSKSTSSGDDETPDYKPDSENKPAELPNYAQDTLKEVLGWYGLGEGGEGNEHKGLAEGPQGEPAHLDTSRHSDRPLDRPLDLTNGHSTPDGLARSSFSLSGHRKLIGMRFLFPPLSEEMSLYEKAKIWVARHDYKYFVGLTDEELGDVEPILRPITPVTPELYKLHMNRSEYCRNVKLKYCLESDASWAREFHGKLRKPVSEGGFTGLCQAKIAAAELWRKYSENYRSHQARYPNPKSRYRGNRRHSDNIDVDLHGRVNQTADSNDEMEDDEDTNQDETKRPRMADEEDMVEGDQSHDPDDVSLSSSSAQALEAMNYDSDGAESGLGESHGSQGGLRIDARIEENRNPSEKTAEVCADSPINVEAAAGSCTQGTDMENREKDSRPPRLMITVKEEKDVGSLNLTSALPFYNPMHLYQTPMNPLICPTSSREADFSPSSYVSAYTTPHSIASEPIYRHAKHGEKSTEYKRSERGLSFLFPSLSDHNLSLLDKVKITVIRHKNNYFLGWTEEELKNIDPLIRPKMVVSPEIYKEYCHRNAMKYDSNLQFAMESPEQWAREFRAKLSRPPSEGGFSSLCEVKLEAGRLWREYSGKYRMHNIVKWQMDMNSATKSVKKHKLEGIECEVKEEPNEKSNPPSSVTSSQSSPVLPSHVGGLLPYPGMSSDPPYPLREEAHHTNTRQRSHRQRGPNTSRISHSNSPMGEEESAVCVSTPPEPMAWSRNPSLASPLAFEQCAMPGPRYFIPFPDMDIPSYLQSLATKQGETNRDKGHDQGHLYSKPQRDQQNDLYDGRSKGKNIISPDLPQCDSLFKPLPKYMPVADQVYVWLERHKNNYFFGYPQQRLLLLGEYLRPNMIVTEEVFKRFVPESMVDILSKIQHMMLSTEAAAKVFQERLHKPPSEGGFATFEEALTEAVVLWTSTKQVRDMCTERQRFSFPNTGSPSKSDSDDMNNNSPRGPSPKPEESSKQSRPTESSGPVSAQYNESTAENTRSLGVPATRAAPSAQIDLEAPSAGTSIIRPGSSPEDTSPSPADQRSSHRPSTSSPPGLDLQTSTEAGLAGGEFNLWECRSYLQSLCEEDASQSWHGRLVPYLAILRKHLGGDYTPPPSTNHCVLDLLLAALYNKHHLQSE